MQQGSTIVQSRQSTAMRWRSRRAKLSSLPSQLCLTLIDTPQRTLRFTLWRSATTALDKKLCGCMGDKRMAVRLRGARIPMGDGAISTLERAIVATVRYGEI